MPDEAAQARFEGRVLQRRRFSGCALRSVAGALAAAGLLGCLAAEGVLAWASSSGLLLCAAFLAANGDLVVQCFDLVIELSRFRQSNAAFERSLEEGAAKVWRLRRTARGLELLESNFGGSAEAALQQGPETFGSRSRAEALRSCGALCRLYVEEVSRDSFICEGRELKEALEKIAPVLLGAFPDFLERAARLREGLEASRRFVRDGGVRGAMFPRLLETALEAQGVREIPGRVEMAMAEEDDSPEVT
mmetsp:Transcript_50553/g.110335  ORF Transcript_50553/g.110335 Transcript_50553/m.110335 type:complete len:248 (-) Transcript_50553:64-807(-)